MIVNNIHNTIIIIRILVCKIHKLDKVIYLIHINNLLKSTI